MTAIPELEGIVGAENVLRGDRIDEGYSHDECLTTSPVVPELVVRAVTTDQVARVLRTASAHGIPVTIRGAGTGLSGGCLPHPGGILLALDRMNRILEIDEANHVAVVEPGVTLAQLDEALAPRGLVYPIFPGENSATLGGNVATNAGGMRAVKYGVTRNQVLGLEAVLPSGEVIRTGGKFVKVSSGYDLTQLLVGSEGTLAVVTQVTVKLFPRMPIWSTVLAPFRKLPEVTRAVPALVMSGAGPLLVEYIDRMTMMGITGFTGLELGIPEAVKDAAEAYLLVVVEGRDDAAVQADVEALGAILGEQGALDVFVLPGAAGSALVDAREKSFWVGKRLGLADIIDVVVPRASIPDYVARVQEIAGKHGVMISGCGHAGDGNIHLGVFEQDATRREAVMHDLLAAGVALGGAVSAEHGIGHAKRRHLGELEDETKLALYRGVKAVFDPKGILNPGVLLP
ncbi:MAG: FAD-binding oxidoreductase [Deltaproteobacteria bacterium]|nr:FAD-binding oxidoreductase [Deltaproteobacteria bacterium]